MAEASGGRTGITPLASVKLLILRLDEMEEMAKLGRSPYKVLYTDLATPESVPIPPILS